MAKKYVQVTGLHNIFDTLDDLNNGSVKASVSDLIDNYTIIYATCDTTDEVNFKHPYVVGSHIIYTRKTPYFVSGKFVQTINSEAPDSAGNIDIEAAVPVISKGTSDTTFTIEPNKVYVWDEVSSLDISLATPSSDSIVNHYFFQFTSGSTATTLALPDTIIYIGDSTISANKKYQVSILNNVAIIGGATVSS